MPRVIATSDLHGSLPEVPACDVLLLGGDLCPDHPMGKAARYNLHDNGAEFQFDWLHTTFREWLGDCYRNGVRNIVAIAGNHDFVFEKMSYAVRELHLPWTYLEDSEAVVAGLRIYGTPWVPGLPRWAFHQDYAGLQRKTKMIPSGLDVLMTHGPPFGTADFVSPQFGSIHVGSEPLRDQLPEIKPNVVVCGHIHEGFGVHSLGNGSVLYNVSHNDENYSSNRRPPVLLTELLT